MAEYRKKHLFEHRIREANKVLDCDKYRVPIIVIKDSNTKDNIPVLKSNKYRVNRDINMQQFLYLIRKALRIDSSVALFFFIDNDDCKILVPNNDTVGIIYEKYHNIDNFLYIVYIGESTFGELTFGDK